LLHSFIYSAIMLIVDSIHDSVGFRDLDALEVELTAYNDSLEIEPAYRVVAGQGKSNRGKPKAKPKGESTCLRRLITHMHVSPDIMSDTLITFRFPPSAPLMIQPRPSASSTWTATTRTR
jgi:hypothetical protein